MASILCVCLGNICRSPSAEAVFRKKLQQAGLDFTVDSAGTGAWHQGEPPDTRAQQAGMARGYDFSGQSARAVTPQDFIDFDHIFAMDSRNYQDLMRLSPPAYQHKISLLLSLVPELAGQDIPDKNIPDPYYGGPQGFETVLDKIETACEAFIEKY